MNGNRVEIRFRNAQFLVLFNRILAFMIAAIVLRFKRKHSNRRSIVSSIKINHSSSIETNHRSLPPYYLYVFCSLSNIMSSWCQYEALKYVSFPAQVLSKGCKMIPTMLMNSLMIGKKQKREEWFFALMISFGMTIFLLNEKRQTSSDLIGKFYHQFDPNLEQFQYSFLSGVIILILYLTFDSFTSNWQQSLFDQYHSLTSFDMMFAVNLFSVLFTSISLMKQHDFWPILSILVENPVLLRDCIILSICSAAGQLFIFYTISKFGAIIFTLIMTLRQALAILLSCLIYSHQISSLGFVGILIIFGSLLTKYYQKFRMKKQPKSKSNQNVL